MRAPDRRQDEAALERLRDHEAALSRRMETARADAEQVRAEAEQRAAALITEEHGRIEAEVAALALAAAGALEQELCARREEASRAVVLTRAQAGRRSEDAVARIVAIASGSSP